MTNVVFSNAEDAPELDEWDRACFRLCVGIVVLNERNKVFIGKRSPKKSMQNRRWINEQYNQEFQILQKDPEILNLEKEGAPYLRDFLWQFPQGGIDEGESVERAAFRELSEETGIENAKLVATSASWYDYVIPPSLYERGGKGRFKGQRQRWVLMHLRTEDARVVLNHDPANQEFEEWTWIEPIHVPRLIIPFKQKLYIEVLKDFNLI